ncbi:MAG: hypothetical protein GX817_06615 [Elusimicrobia bacterium]|nr:hypothetical protein [Elusimicrobiota bacterium]
MNGFYLLIIPLAIYELTKHKNQRMKYPLFASLLLILISFLLTQSIWGTAVLILSLILTLSIHFKLKVPKVAYFIPLLRIVIVLLSGYDITERLSWLGAGIKIISKRPLFGFGPGSRAQILPLFTEAKSLSIYIHSYFIQIGAETGLISLLGIIILLWGILKELFSGDEERKVAGISLISVLVYNFLEYNLSVPLVYLTFALISGAYLNASFSLSVFKNKILAVLSIVMLTPLLYYFTAHYLSALVFSAGRHEILHNKDRIRAEELYKSSLEIYPFPPSEYALAALYFNEGNNSQAEIIIQQSQSANLIDKTTKRSGTKEILSTGLIQFGIDPLELLNQD